MTSSPVLTFRQNPLVLKKQQQQKYVTNIPTDLLGVELNGEKLIFFFIIKYPTK